MKIVLSVLVSTLLSLGLQAQNDTQLIKKIKFGIVGNANLMKSPAISYIDVTSAFRNYRKSKYALGADVKLAMEYFSSKRFSLQPELGFAYYHQRHDYSTSPTNERIASAHYDDLYVTAITLGNMFKYAAKHFSIITGPQVDFPLSAKITSIWKSTNSVTEVSQRTHKVDLKESKKMTAVAFSWIFGAEHTLNNRLRIQASYKLGLSRYANRDANWQIGEISGFAAGIGFRF